MEQPGESRLESLLLDSAVPDRRAPRRWRRFIAGLAVVLAALSWYWSRLPDLPGPDGLPGITDAQRAPQGAVIAATLCTTVQTLLDKPGGWLSNDVMPPGVWLDNMPAFERGALAAVRDFVRAAKRDFAHGDTQSLDDPDLQRAEPRLAFDGSRWLASEAEYREGLAALSSYRDRLLEPAPAQAQFRALPEGLVRWLDDVDARLAGEVRALAGASPESGSEPTAWTAQDDLFFEARGHAWALQAQLAAVALDFRGVLAERHAGDRLASAMRELAGTQRPLRSPLILGGSEYGMLANHSLVMAGYLARARNELQALRAALAVQQP